MNHLHQESPMNSARKPKFLPSSGLKKLNQRSETTILKSDAKSISLNEIFEPLAAKEEHKSPPSP